MMQQVVVNTDSLHLPGELRRKIVTEQVLIRETGEGLLLVPFCEQTKKIRGILKGSGYSTERFFEQKRADKELEA
jgi:hypothetical protein